ncbi:MAG: iron-binding protein [Campylobacterota bacterium]|nr:iron-binding protein [Campylobacterota bacterium]
MRGLILLSLNEIYQSKHELWLKVLYSSFAINDEKIKSKIYDFAQIEFRHLKWLSNKLKENNINYNYEKYAIDIQKNTTFEYFEYIISEIKLCLKKYNTDEALFARMISDEFYFINELETLLKDKNNNTKITAFNKNRVYENKNLDDISKDALTIFLFEESYKEYELILLYSYFQNYTNDILQYNVYQDMIDESQFHLKSFGNMMAKMGILAIPRTVIESLYINKDVKQFLIDGVDEEIKAKEECASLAEAIKDEEISQFLTFIMYQEDYHITLMKKAIKQFND